VNHYATNPASFDRCRGFADAIGADFKSSTLDAGDDPTQIEAKVSAYLRNHKDTQAVLALGPTSAHPSMKALQKMGLDQKIFFATFDLSDEIAKGIKEGASSSPSTSSPTCRATCRSRVVLAIMKKEKTTDLAKVTAALKSNAKFKGRLPEYGLDRSTAHATSARGWIRHEDNIAKVRKLHRPTAERPTQPGTVSG
jgi:simple sugar transport system substrate-binding protein